MNIMILGASGMVGKALIPKLGHKHKIIEISRSSHHFPFPTSMHNAIFYGLVIMDALSGVLILLKPSRILYLLLIIIVLGYTLTITLFVPMLWQDPFGSLLKNIPILSWLLLLHQLEKNRG